MRWFQDTLYIVRRRVRRYRNQKRNVTLRRRRLSTRSNAPECNRSKRALHFYNYLKIRFYHFADNASLKSLRYTTLQSRLAPRCRNARLNPPATFVIKNKHAIFLYARKSIYVFQLTLSRSFLQRVTNIFRDHVQPLAIKY